MIFQKLKSLHHSICYWVACGFGSGLFKYAPGTFATIILGVPLYISICKLTLIQYVFIISMAIVIGIYICDVAEQLTHQPDNPVIVWDEICGYVLTMLHIPGHIEWIVIGFLLFRLFDIVKPWPIYAIDQQVKGGIGIMLDDLLAAGYANLILHALIYITG